MKSSLGNPMVAAQAASTATELLKLRQQAKERKRAEKAARGPRFNEDQRNLINNVLLGLGGLGLAGLLVLIGKGIVGNIQEKGTLSHSDDLTRPEGIAFGLREAMRGMGTDEQKIQELLLMVPHREFWEKVKRHYSRLPGVSESLIEAFQSDLDSRELKDVQAILRSLPKDEREAAQRANGVLSPAALQALAERLHLAFNLKPWGTDEEAVYRVFREVPLARTLIDLDRAYRGKYGEGLLPALQDELDQREMSKVIQIIKQKRDAQGKKLSEIFA